LQEGKITSVSDELFNYTKDDQGKVIPVPHSPFELTNWQRKAERIEKQYSKRLGMVIGDVELIFHCDMLKGLKRLDDGSMVKEYDDIPGIDADYAAQTVVMDVGEEDPRFIEKAAVPISEEFPEGARAFFLGEFNYGQPLEVIDHVGDKANIWVSTMVCYIA
jgi:5'-3' exoribonuclease 1